MYCQTQVSCCHISNEHSSQACNVETSFCGTTTVGIDLGNCATSDINDPTPLFNTYTIIYNLTMHVKVGYNILPLSPGERFEYRPGDIMGWLKTSSNATIGVDFSHGKYNIIETVASLPKTDISLNSIQRSSNRTGTVLLAGIASKSIDFITNISAPNTPGVKNISFMYQTSEETTIIRRPVSFLYPVSNISFTSASNSCAIYGPSNEAFNISILFHGGTNAQVTWKVNNTTVVSFPYITLGNQDEMTCKQNFTFSSVGELPLIVLVTNEVSGMLLTASFIIQEKITGLSAAKANISKIVYQGLITQLSVSISTGTNVTYKWYFGDGSGALTGTSKTIAHSYHKFGQINTTVEATNMVSSVNYSFIIDVSNPVQIIVPPFAISNVSTNVTCKLSENLLETYSIVLQIDNDSLVSSNCTTVGLALTPGLHDIHCHIQTAVVLYSNTSLFAVEPITGLSIVDIPPLALDTSHKVEANISAGNNITYVWQLLGKTYPGSTPPIMFNQVGKIKLIVNAFNVISNVTAEKLVTIQEPIGKLNVNASANPAITDLEVSFNIIPTAGSGEINCTVNISTMGYRDLGPILSFTDSFPQEGIYNMIIIAKNLISSSNTTYHIRVQVPVKRRPEITCPFVSLKDKTCIVATNKQWEFIAEIPYATNVSFVWMWGRRVSNKTDSSPSDTQFNTTSRQSQSFPEPENFNITVITRNDVSKLLGFLHVETLDEVMDLTFQSPQAVAVNTSFAITSSISKGSNVTYLYDFGVKNGKIDVLDTKVRWNYSKVGVYEIKVNASNLVSDDATSRNIYVQEEIIDVVIEKINTVETNISTSIEWTVKGGTNVTSNVTFGDGSYGIIKHTECQKSNFIPTITRCNTAHNWPNSGKYNVHIEANNLLTTKKSSDVEVTIQDRIKDLSVQVNSVLESGKYFVAEGIRLTFSLTSGTGVQYEIHLNDSNRIETTTERSFTIQYYKQGNYNPWVNASNEVNSQTFSVEDILVEVPPEPVEIENLKLSAKPTKFNESTIFEVSYDKGALFKCSFTFDNEGTPVPIEEKDLYKGMTHKYKSPGTFVASLKCSNTKGDKNEKVVKTEVFVHIPIKGFELKTSTLSVAYKNKVTINFEWLQGSHMEVIAYTENKEVVNAIDLNYTERSGVIVFPYNYFSSPGRYLIHVNASNKVSSFDKNATVNIVQQIKDVKVLFNPYVAVLYRLRAYVSVEEGSDMNVTWNFGDGSRNKRKICEWKESCYSDHIYNETGNYTISVKVENELNSGADNKIVKIEYPVFGWDFKSVGINKANKPTIVQLIYNKTFKFPTDAKYSIQFNQNGEKTKENRFINIGSVERNYTYTKAGCYQARAILKNKVSTVVLETTIKVRGDYDEANINAQSLKEDSNSSTFPLEYPVRFTPNINNDCLKYNWTITDQNSIILARSHLHHFEHTFNSSGSYKINFIAFDNDNNNDNVTATKMISVDRSVTGLYLSSDGVGKANETVEFILLWATLGTSTKFKVDFNDRSEMKNLSLDKRTKDFRKYLNKLSFDPTGLEGIIFSHNFSRIGEYQIKVSVNDEPKLQTQVSISKAPCPLPVITVNGGNNDANRAPVVPYEVQYTLFSKVKVNLEKCSDKINIDFKWRVFKADEHLLETTGSSVIPPDENREVE